MKHFITFQKRKGLQLPRGDSRSINTPLADAIVMELMKNGYRPDLPLYDALVLQSPEVLAEVYNDLCKGINDVMGGSGYEPIYRNFPQSVIAMSYREFVINALVHYWTFGTWRPEDEGYLQREFAIEPINYKPVTLITEKQFYAIFTDIVYSGSSISKWDKEIVDWFLDNTAIELNLDAIKFNETKAYIGQRLLTGTKALPIKYATAVLRIWAAYSGGDEGLKTNTKFKAPNSTQKRILSETLNGCVDLEESFKTYREQWLRVLFYLNPMATANKAKYPTLAEFTDRIRNRPETLKTFNSYVETYIAAKDQKIFDLLSKRLGVFMRRLDHLVRVFGTLAVDKFLETSPSMEQLVTIYNHFSDRDQSKDRAVVLAGQDSSTLSTFGALDAMDSKVVDKIRELVLDAINAKIVKKNKIFIDRSLYYRPLALNNRASSMSLDSKAIGTCELLPEGKTLRAYVHWHGGNDIDLSAMVITSDNGVSKVGWNGRHHLTESIIYSGDNTGYSSKNAEYIDIVFDKLPSNIEWIILDANVYRGETFKNWRTLGGVRAGWMMRAQPKANSHWLPETVEHSMKITSDAKSSYLLAVHVPTRNLVYLDMDNRSSRITTAEDALKFRIFLDKFVNLDNGDTEISWKKIAQGHILNVLAQEVVDNPEQADVIFDENTTWEQVSKILVEESL